MPTKPSPKGSVTCPAGGCGPGNCHFGLGLCMCPAGWSGPTCAQPQKRPCTNRLRQVGEKGEGERGGEGEEGCDVVQGIMRGRDRGRA